MSTPSRISPWFLQRRDQAVVALLVLAGIVTLAGYWFIGQYRHGWIEIDTAEPAPVQFLVDVNTADWTELSQLPGIGETLAKRIIERRETVGPYRSAADLRKVSGIGPKILERIQPHLTFETPSRD